MRPEVRQPLKATPGASLAEVEGLEVLALRLSERVEVLASVRPAHLVAG